MSARSAIVAAAISTTMGCRDGSFQPLHPPGLADDAAPVDSGTTHPDTGPEPDTGDTAGDTDDAGIEPLPEWFKPAACEENALAYVGHDESVLFNSFAWTSPDDGGIIMRAAITEPGGPTACDLFSTDPSPYEFQPLIVNIWTGEGNDLGPHEVTMEEAKDEAEPPPGDPTELDGLGADAVVRLSDGNRLRSTSLGQVFQILHYGAEDPLVVDERFQATFNDGSVLEAGSWVACYCPEMVAFGSE